MKTILYKIALAAITLIVLVGAFAEPHRVSGDCMEPAIMDGRLYFLNRISPYLRQYRIGDIVLFQHEGKVWVSRIAALETNTIQIVDGSIVVDGTTLHDGIRRNWSNWKYGAYGIDMPLQIPADHVFVLSDNLSAHHDDSRVFGPVSKESILGLVWQF